jgi:hypothetical protein
MVHTCSVFSCAFVSLVCLCVCMCMPALQHYCAHTFPNDFHFPRQSSFHFFQQNELWKVESKRPRASTHTSGNVAHFSMFSFFFWKLYALCTRLSVTIICICCKMVILIVYLVECWEKSFWMEKFINKFILTTDYQSVMNYLVEINNIVLLTNAGFCLRIVNVVTYLEW